MASNEQIQEYTVRLVPSVRNCRGKLSFPRYMVNVLFVWLIRTAQELDLCCKQTVTHGFDQWEFHFQYQLLVCYCFNFNKTSFWAVQIRPSQMPMGKLSPLLISTLNNQIVFVSYQGYILNIFFGNFFFLSRRFFSSTFSTLIWTVFCFTRITARTTNKWDICFGYLTPKLVIWPLNWLFDP